MQPRALLAARQKKLYPLQNAVKAEDAVSIDNAVLIQRLCLDLVLIKINMGIMV
jgi:hypothetical protein